MRQIKSRLFFFSVLFGIFFCGSAFLFLRGTRDAGFDRHSETLSPQLPSGQSPDLPTLPASSSAPPGPQQLPKSPELQIHPEVKKVSQFFQAGKFRKAYMEARLLLLDEGSDDLLRNWLRQQWAGLVDAAAWEYIREDRCEEALALISSLPDQRLSKVSLKGMGFCARKLKQNELAAYAFERFLEWEPGNEQMTQLAVDNLETLGRFTEALSAVERLALISESKWTLQKRKQLHLLAARSPLESERETEHFTLRFRADEYEDLAEFSLNLLEEAHEELVSSFGFPALRQRIEVIFYKDRRDFSYAEPEAPIWAGAVFDGRIKIPLGQAYQNEAERSDLRRMLRHELVHALLSQAQSKRQRPGWLEEGLAQRFECTTPCRVTSPLGSKWPAFRSFKELSQPYSQFLGEEVSLVYKQSLYFIRVIEADADFFGPEGLSRLIAQIREGKDSDSYLKPAFAVSDEQVYQRVLSFWQNRVRL